MSEPETPDEGDEEERAEDHTAFALPDGHSMFINPAILKKGAPGESDHEMLAMMRDQFFQHTLVFGSNPPSFDFEADRCAAGCHLNLWVVDSANDERYLVQQMPSFIAQMSGYVDFNGQVNPTLVKHEIARREAVLN